MKTLGYIASTFNPFIFFAAFWGIQIPSLIVAGETNWWIWFPFVLAVHSFAFALWLFGRKEKQKEFLSRPFP